MTRVLHRPRTLDAHAGMVDDVPIAELVYYDLVHRVQRDFSGRYRFRLSLIAAVGIAIGCLIWYVLTTGWGYSLERVLGTGLAILLIAVALFFSFIFAEWIPSALYLSDIGPQYIRRCMTYFEELALDNQTMLVTIEAMAKNDREAFQAGTSLPNVLWAGIIAVVAVWNVLPTTISFLIISGAVVLMTLSSHLLNSERTKAVSIIIQAITVMRALRARQEHADLQQLLAQKPS
jgi:hypothetical protein